MNTWERRIVPALNLLLFCGAVFLYFAAKNEQAKPYVLPEQTVGTPVVETGPLGTRDVIRNVPFDVEVRIDPQQPVTGKKSTVYISISKDGEPAEIISMGRIMQATLISEDLQDYRHFLFDSIKDTGPGQYQFDYLFSRAGRYNLYVDINHNIMPDHHGDMTDLRSITAFDVEGETLESFGGILEPSWTYEQDGYTVKIDEADLRTGELSILNVSVTDPEGKPATFVLTDPFYTVNGPTLDTYTLEHFHLGQSTDLSLATQELEFRHPGQHLFWGFLYVFKDNGNEHVLRPLFLLDVEDGYEH